MEGSRGNPDRGEVARQGREKASEYAGKGREQAESQIATRKDQAAGQVEGVANALRRTGEQLHEQDQGSVGRYAEQAAEQAERFSDYLRDRDADQLLGDVEDFARERPAVFLGGAFLLGAAAARFLKSSAGQREEFDVRENARKLGSSATGGDMGSGSGGESEEASETDRSTREERLSEEDRTPYSEEEDRYARLRFEDDDDRTTSLEDFDVEEPFRRGRGREPR